MDDGKKMVEVTTKKGVCNGRWDKNQHEIYVDTQCAAPCGTDTQPLKDAAKGPVERRAEARHFQK